MDDVRDELASLVGKPNLDKRLKQWAKSTSAYDDIGDAIFVPAVLTNIAGQLMVYGHEAQTVRLDAREEVTAFLDLPWEQAIAEWKARGLQDDDEFEVMLKGYAERSDVARQLMLERIQDVMRTALQTAIADGTSMKQFADDVRDGTVSLGISQADPSYLDTVFRTNVQAAYGAGRYRAMTDPDVMEARPYVQYRTAGDALVRPSHAILDQKVWSIQGDAWHKVAPPNGFRCRCSQVTLSPDEARGLDIIDDIPKGGEPDPGFDGPPVARLDPETAMSRVWSLAYNPGQDRAEDGKWTDGFPGGGAKHSRLKTAPERHAHLAPHKERLRKAAEAHAAAPTDESESEMETAHAKLRTERRKLARTDLEKDGVGFDPEKKKNTRSRFDEEERADQLQPYKDRVEQARAIHEEHDNEHSAQRLADAEQRLAEKRRNVAQTENWRIDRPRAQGDAEIRQQELGYHKKQYAEAKAAHEAAPTKATAAKLEAASHALKAKRAEIGASAAAEDRAEFGKNATKHKAALAYEPGSEDRQAADDEIFDRGIDEGPTHAATEAERIYKRNTSPDELGRVRATHEADADVRAEFEDDDGNMVDEDGWHANLERKESNYLDEQEAHLNERLKSSLGSKAATRKSAIVYGATPKTVERSRKLLEQAQKRGDPDAAAYWQKVMENGQAELSEKKPDSE